MEADNENNENSASSDEEKEEQEIDSKIQKLILESEANPYQYDKHIELITALRSTGDLDQLRNAREAMSVVYPLSEELWLEWFQDELPLAVIPEQKEYLLSKFELAVKDYTSTKIWHEYCQFVMNNIESPADIDRARNVFENAITAVGLHVTEGPSVWDGYREFEIAILDSYQQLQNSGDTVGMDAKVQAQTDRISTIFKRQLSIPLLGMADTFNTYEDWAPEPINDQTKRIYEKATERLLLCMEFEENLHSASGNNLQEYQKYITYEIKGGDPARIQCIFERAIKDNCLQHELWERYTTYLDYKLKIRSISVAVHERAVRNCPWVGKLWVNYLNALERNQTEYVKYKEVFDQSLKGGFAGAESYLEVWLSNCDYHRRRIADWTSEETKVEELHKVFEGAITYMNHYFGLEGDKYCVLLREWAYIEAKHLQNLKRAQELWDTVMKKHPRDVTIWMEYIHFLMLFGDVVIVRRVFQRCSQISFEFPESICEAFIKFERQYGSLDDVDDAHQKVEAQLKRVKDKRERECLKETSLQKSPDINKKSKHQLADETRKKKKKKVRDKNTLKRNADTALESNEPKAKKSKGSNVDTKAVSGDIPEMYPEVVQRMETEHKTIGECTTESTTTEFRTSSVEASTHDNERDLSSTGQKSAISASEITGSRQDENKQLSIQQKMEDISADDNISKVDNERSVFLSNLLFTVDETQIRDMFSICGPIDTVRIILNRAGKSKGFAYLEFKEKEFVKKALKLDRNNLSGRPVFVSECVDKKQNPTKFKFPTTIDKHTLYVSNIPFEVTEDELKVEFGQVGILHQVRLVTNRSGKSKGYAYVEYETETDATSAIMKFDQHVFKGRPINVAISNPPARKNPETQQVMEKKMTSSAGENQPRDLKAPEGSRGRAKTQLSLVPRSLVPRVVQKEGAQTHNKPAPEEKTPGDQKQLSTTTKMSNSEFRKFLK